MGLLIKLVTRKKRERSVSELIDSLLLTNQGCQRLHIRRNAHNPVISSRFAGSLPQEEPDPSEFA